MNIDEKIAEYKADIEKCERVCEMTAIGSIRDAALRKAEDCRQMLEWLEDYKRLKKYKTKQKEGYWIYYKTVNTGTIILSECSECGSEESGCAKRMKYCPYCGIKMKAESEDNNGD